MADMEHIKRNIEGMTKQEISSLLHSKYCLDIRDYEGSSWTKQEGINLLASEIYRGIESTEIVPSIAKAITSKGDTKVLPETTEHKEHKEREHVYKLFLTAGKRKDTDKLFLNSGHVYDNGTIFHKNDYSNIIALPKAFYKEHFKYDRSTWIYRTELSYGDVKQYTHTIKHI